MRNLIQTPGLLHDKPKSFVEVKKKRKKEKARVVRFGLVSFPPIQPCLSGVFFHPGKDLHCFYFISCQLGRVPQKAHFVFFNEI